MIQSNNRYNPLPPCQIFPFFLFARYRDTSALLYSSSIT